MQQLPATTTPSRSMQGGRFRYLWAGRCAHPKARSIYTGYVYIYIYIYIYMCYCVHTKTYWPLIPRPLIVGPVKGRTCTAGSAAAGLLRAAAGAAAAWPPKGRLRRSGPFNYWHEDRQWIARRLGLTPDLSCAIYDQDNMSANTHELCVVLTKANHPRRNYSGFWLLTTRLRSCTSSVVENIV